MGAATLSKSARLTNRIATSTRNDAATPANSKAERLRKATDTTPPKATRLNSHHSPGSGQANQSQMHAAAIDIVATTAVSAMGPSSCRSREFHQRTPVAAAAVAKPTPAVIQYSADSAAQVSCPTSTQMLAIVIA